MRYLSPLLLLAIIVLWSSCRKDFESAPSIGNLEFSTDTLLLDTVFTNIGSSTYSFKVYNRTNEDFTIPSITLERGESSNYRLNVDGVAGKSFRDIQVLAKDSIFVFVETTTNITDQTGDLEFLYTDRVLFDPNGNQQDVDLVTLIKDGVFLFPSRNTMTGEVSTIPFGIDCDNNQLVVEGFFLQDDQLNFTSEKPYVIYGFAVIPPGKTLTIDPGARIHFHQGSGIIAANNSTLLVNGELSTDPIALENEVIFEGDRLEPIFSEVVGQWGFIFLGPGSTGHKINHATIKNASIGLVIQGTGNETEPSLDLRNTQIYNSSNVGLQLVSSNVFAENVVINNAGLVSLYCTLGGTYNFNHSTFANYWSQSFSRELPAVLLQNYILQCEDQVILNNLVEANFSNCIIYGNRNIELLLDKVEGASFNYNFKNCLIRFDEDNNLDNQELYDFTNTSLFENIILDNEFKDNADFKRNLDKFDNDNEDVDDDLRSKSRNFMNIGEESFANGKAMTPGMGTDILGTTRDADAPDIGAYESVMFETDN